MLVMPSAVRAIQAIIGAVPSMKKTHTYHGDSLSTPENGTQKVADIAPMVILSVLSADKIIHSNTEGMISGVKAKNATKIVATVLQNLIPNQKARVTPTFWLIFILPKFTMNQLVMRYMDELSVSRFFQYPDSSFLFLLTEQSVLCIQ